MLFIVTEQVHKAYLKLPEKKQKLFLQQLIEKRNA